MKVFRVEERATGRGPYWGTMPGIHEAHGSSRKHPGPFSEPDIGSKFEYGMLFGFESMEQFDKWFKGWKRTLHKYDFVIRVYEVKRKKVLIGKRQVAFWHEGSQLVDTLPVVRYSR